MEKKYEAKTYNVRVENKRPNCAVCHRWTGTACNEEREPCMYNFSLWNWIKAIFK